MNRDPWPHAVAVRRGGIGRALVRAAIWWAQSRSLAAFEFTAPADASELRHFLDGQGFKVRRSLEPGQGRGRRFTLSRPLEKSMIHPLLETWPARHPAEQAIRAKEARDNMRRHGHHGALVPSSTESSLGRRPSR